LREKLFDARASLRLNRAKLQAEHTKLLQNLRQTHHLEIEKLNSQLQSRNQRPAEDEVDVCFEALRSGRSKHREEFPLEEVRRWEKRLSELRADVQNAQKKLVSIKMPDVDFEFSPQDLEKLRANHELEITQLDVKLTEEIDRGREVERAILQAKREGTELVKEGKELEKIEAEPEDPVIRCGLNLMSDEQKKMRAKELTTENTRLKKEIARLDFMIYGKTGRYQMWKYLKCGSH
jgi:chromosome segregation ATPase